MALLYVHVAAADCSTDGVLVSFLIIMTNQLQEATPESKDLLWLTVSEDTLQCQKDLITKMPGYIVIGA